MRPPDARLASSSAGLQRDVAQHREALPADVQQARPPPPPPPAVRLPQHDVDKPDTSAVKAAVVVMACNRVTVRYASTRPCVRRPHCAFALFSNSRALPTRPPPTHTYTRALSHPPAAA